MCVGLCRVGVYFCVLICVGVLCVYVIGCVCLLVVMCENDCVCVCVMCVCLRFFFCFVVCFS